MTDRFKVFIPFVLRWEGSVYENDPDDPGGETKFGIDKASHPKEDIRNLTEARAKEIYFDEYWTPLRCEELPPKIGEAVMDIGVNNGKSRAARWLQELVLERQDGIIGRHTIEATVLAHRDELLDALLTRRENFYRSIAKGRLAKFLGGWLNRNADLRRYLTA